MKKIFLILFIFIGLSFSSFAQLSPEKRTEWFKQDRFGMFIHWGLYSAAEGLWKGEKLRYVNNYAEWIRYRNRISKEEYGTLATRFDWDKINPEQWVLLAKEAGMKYIIITTKHHDGVAIWDTKIGDYSLPKLSGSKRDVIKELADACRKHGMKLGFYYSHWIDWEHPYAWNHMQELTGRVTDAQFNQYWQEKALPQLRELLTNYGDIAIMWFDMWIPYQKTIFKKEQLDQAIALIRELQPDCLINSRLGLPASDPNIDFETLGDNQFGTAYTTHPWETPGTIAHSWGYNAQENEWKSTTQLFNSLIGNVSMNGDFTLNIGPRADGTVPYESISRLRDLGNWLTKNGEALYGNTGLELRTDQHDWGKLTTKMVNGKQMVYAHVFNWPLDHILRVSGISSTPSGVELWKEDGSKEKLAFDQTGPLIHVKLPSSQSNPFVSVVAFEFPQAVTLEKDIAGESTFGGFSLNSINTINKDFKVVRYDGLKPTHLIVDQPKEIRWKVYIPKAGTYSVAVSAHNPNKENVEIKVTEGNHQLEGKIAPTGKMVAEPNENNYVDEFVDTSIGTLQFSNAGAYEIRFQIKGNKPLWLNRIWLEEK
ncbi:MULTISPECIES: alpha-L-fucosidase [unclassified Sphingobacterium]|uniref:alpha-L-fucosidase n=1 Tax=unclassified Sphingobacterium TaxID=2609468 RepID=UPI0025DF064E|nr:MULTISPECIES: alpha-L-fucosidase [unclassified Sphingobacterium]